jgi:putative ABC transport system permease protein
VHRDQEAVKPPNPLAVFPSAIASGASDLRSYNRAMARARIRFGLHEFDPDASILFCRGERCVLQSQPARLLGLLIEHAGEIVTRDQIRRELWPDTVVAYDQGINFAIRQIRIALGGDADLVQTVPRRGYRFTGEIRRELITTHQNSANRRGEHHVGFHMRLAIRNLVRAPGLAGAILVTLTVALAFTFASFGLLDGLLVRPYSYPRLPQLQLVRDGTPREGAHQGHSIAVADFLDARQRVTAFSALTGWRPQPIVITNPNSEPERIEAAAVTADFFDTLGVTPLGGRPFAADADTPGHDDVVLLSRRLWNSRFGADPSTVGREINLNGRRATVIGIIRDEDCYPSGVDAWVPLVFAPAELTERAAQRVAAIGRLADGASASFASGQLAALAQTLAARYPLTNRGRGFVLMPLQREQFEFTAPLFLFVLAAALLVLVLAVVNVCNLLIGRTLDRRRELVVRAVLGGSTSQIAAVAIAEVVVLVGAATLVAAIAAGGILNVIRASLPEGIARWIAGWSSLTIDRAALSGGIGVGLLVMAGIAGAVALTSVRAARDGGASLRTTRRSTWPRRVLVAGEVGLAASLLLGASVMVSGFARISAAFETLAPARLLRFTLTLPESRYPDDRRVAAFHDRMLERLRALPEVEDAALIRNEPASNVPNPTVPFRRDDAPALAPSEMPKADVQVVSPSAFATLRLQLLDGRAIDGNDTADGAAVAVVSRAASRRFWPDRNPVGTTIRLGTDQRQVRIAGVVSDFTLNWYDPEMRPVIYLPDSQAPARTTSVVVRTKTDPMSLARRVRAAVAEMDDRQPVSGIEPLSTTIADSLSPVRVIERLLLVAAALSAALAALGIYGVLAYWVGARQREMGVRFALGATRRSIAGLVLNEALWTAGAGIAAGLLAAVLAVRLAGSALLGVPSLDARAMLVVAVAAVALVIAASLGPARRAARVDVAELLRLD